MVQKRIYFAAVLSLFLFINSCDDGISGSVKENLPPRTRLTVDKIELPDGQRLSSRVSLNWWADDPDGFVVGYEFAIKDTSEGAWTFTSRTDSTFIFSPEIGLAEDDVLFKIRAIDNDGLKDPVGARLVLPVRNTVPEVSFDFGELPPDTTFSVMSIGWFVEDQDGFESILSTEIAINDTSSADNWVSIPLPAAQDQGKVFLTFIIENTGSVEEDAEMFLGRSFQPFSGNTISGFRPNSSNKIFIRSKDRSGGTSEVIEQEWQLKRQTSRILFLNDDGTSASATNREFHLNLLAENGVNVDILNITDGSVEAGRKVRISSAFPSVINPTLRKMLAQWDFIYWLSSDLDRNITFAQDIASEFLDNGGKMFITIPSKQIAATDPVLSFLSVSDIGRLQPSETRFLISRNTDIPGNDPSFPVMRTTQILLNVPLERTPGATQLYQADFRTQLISGQVVDYTKEETIALRSIEGNLVYFGLDIRLINGNNNAGQLIQKLVIEELGFQN